MAPVLQCPDCGERHPLNEVPDHGAFPCRGCGRVLKVPEAVAQRASAHAAAGAAAAPTGAETPEPGAAATASGEPAVEVPAATRVMPVVEYNAPAAEPQPPALAPPSSRRLGGPTLGRVPWWMRLLLWIVAVPLSFVVVFEVARLFGFFTNNQMSDLFLARNTSRFWPIARLLPFVALLTAILVQLGVYAIARMRGTRHAR